jgi:hypothetical protein
MNESIQEYGIVSFNVIDNIIQDNEYKMKKIKFTTDILDKVYSGEQPSPEYYLPFYISLFNNNNKYETIEEIRKDNTKLENLFTKGFNDFITNTLKQPLTAATCINFIKNKALVQKFITEYKSKNSSTIIDKSNNIDNYKIFITNVYIFLVKIIFTQDGSFLYKNPDNDSNSNKENNKKLYYIDLKNPVAGKINELINNFIENNKSKVESCVNHKDIVAKALEKTKAEKAAAAAAKVAAEDAEEKVTMAVVPAEIAAAKKEAAKKAEAAEEAKKKVQVAEVALKKAISAEAEAAAKKAAAEASESLNIDDNISLSIKQYLNFESTTRNILDSFFQTKQNKIIKENSYDFKIELDYNKLLKYKIIDIIFENKLYKQNEYSSECFETGNPSILNQIFYKIKEDNEKLKFFKNENEIKNDIKTALRTYYFEKEKNTKQKEKKLYIEIKFIKSKTNSNVVLVTRRLYEGVPTFDDITNFQKKLQEDISKYIKKCQNPKDIEVEVKEECKKICGSKSQTIRNKLWCNICSNYIKCVYDETYNPTEEAKKEEKENKAAKIKQKFAKAWIAKKKAKTPGTGPPGTGQPGTGQPGTGPPGTGQPVAARGGTIKYSKKKTISKKQIIKQPHNASFKLFKS